MTDLMCPHCGWRYTMGQFDAADGLVPDHHAACPGSKQHPRNPDSDRRPLWGVELNQLRAEVERLRAALEFLAQDRNLSGPVGPTFCENLVVARCVLKGADVRNPGEVDAIVSGTWIPTMGPRLLGAKVAAENHRQSIEGKPK